MNGLSPTYQAEDGRDMFIVLVQSAHPYGQLPVYNCYSFDEFGYTWFEAKGVTEEWIYDIFKGKTRIVKMTNADLIQYEVRESGFKQVLYEHPIDGGIASCVGGKTDNRCR